MRWWMNAAGVNSGKIFDDGIVGAAPGDPDFNRISIDEECTRRGHDWSADFMGVTDPPLLSPSASSPPLFGAAVSFPARG